MRASQAKLGFLALGREPVDQRSIVFRLRMAMEEIAELKHENFRVIDCLGLDRAAW